MTANGEPMNASPQKARVAIVVPCFNEGAALLHLSQKLGNALRLLEQNHDVDLIFVDDGSTDDTWADLRDLFARDPRCTLLRHPKNMGLAAAILTGIRAAQTEMVCSIDCDCTYDPLQLALLIPMLTPGVDLVTGSPYHPSGRALHVPGWRLFLSKTASALYRTVLTQKLYTYTSCFRVYRRSTVLKLSLRNSGFLGVAELIGMMDLLSCVIVECPAVLTARAQGQSKMKIVPILAGHLFLLGQLLTLRVRQAFFPRRLTKLAPLS